MYSLVTRQNLNKEICRGEEIRWKLHQHSPLLLLFCFRFFKCHYKNAFTPYEVQTETEQAENDSEKICRLNPFECEGSVNGHTAALLSYPLTNWIILKSIMYASESLSQFIWSSDQHDSSSCNLRLTRLGCLPSSDSSGADTFSEHMT